MKTQQVILFVGAGVSKNLGLPTWGDLLNDMGKQLGFDGRIFHQLGNYLELAEYFKIKKTSLGPIRSWMDREWHKDETKVDSSRIHQSIVDLAFPTIYTTNYDRWLEIAFERRKQPFNKIANVGDFTKLRAGVTEIVKLHGDFDDDSSLVLTESSYFERLSFESPLDLKLRTDILGKSILFIGYGLGDVNVRYLLYKLHRLWADSAYSRSRPDSYLVLSRPNPVQEAILEARGITPIVTDGDDPGEGLSKLLEELRKRAFGKTGGATV